MKTKAIFLEDSYQKEMNAEIVEVKPEGEGRWRLILSDTVFYPMGGGQATDQGILESENWTGTVYQVLMKEGEIVHYVKGDEPPLHCKVRGKIDWERRFRNMRLHSAGHVVDFAVHLLGYSPELLRPLKADHGKKPHIVYQGVLEREIAEELEKKANDIVREARRMSTRFTSMEEVGREAIYIQPGLPKDKPLRMLTLEGVGSVADGGTQVSSTKEIGTIKITKIEEKEGQTMIHYRLEE